MDSNNYLLQVYWVAVKPFKESLPAILQHKVTHHQIAIHTYVTSSCTYLYLPCHRTKHGATMQDCNSKSYGTVEGYSIHFITI